MDSFNDWMSDYGWVIIGILGGWFVVYLVLHYFVAPVVRKAVFIRMRGKDEEEVRQRADNLSRVLVNTGIIILGIVALFLILREIDSDWLDDHGNEIIGILAGWFVIYYVLRNFVPSIVRRTVFIRMRGKDEEDTQQRADTLSGVLVNTGTIILGVVALFMILDEAGVDIAPALLGLGVVGLAVGFGAQSLIKDLIAGIFILLENQYCVGDWVQIAGVNGMVEEINLRRTILRDLDGTVHSIPNGEVTVASNYTKEWGRVNMVVSVGYGEDLDYAIEVINRVGKEMAKETYWKDIMLSTPQVLRVDALGDSGIDIRIMSDTKQMRQWEIMGELRKRIKRVFDEEGIEIPWPHTKLYFGEPLEHRQAGEVKKPPKKRATTKKPETDEIHDDRIAPPSVGGE